MVDVDRAFREIFGAPLTVDEFGNPLSLDARLASPSARDAGEDGSSRPRPHLSSFTCPKCGNLITPATCHCALMENCILVKGE